MSKDNLMSFKAQIDKKDLETFCQALFDQVNKLQVENQLLKEKVDHLEFLLHNVPKDGIVILGE